MLQPRRWPSPRTGYESIYLDIAELEALRLVDLEKLTLKEAVTIYA